MTNRELVPDNLLPTRFKWKGSTWINFGKMNNFHYRIIDLPVGGGLPRHFSNDEVIEILEKNENHV
jgi:hypothetical protein